MKRTKQIQVLLTEEERKILKKLKEQFKGTNSQVLRLALARLNEQKNKEIDTNAT